MKQRKTYQASNKVIVYLMHDHLMKMTRTENTIQTFMVNLTRNMKTLSQNSIAHEASLESLLLCKILFISRNHEVWASYLKKRTNEGDITTNSKLSTTTFYFVFLSPPHNFVLIVTLVKLVERGDEKTCNCFLQNSRNPNRKLLWKLEVKEETQFGGDLQPCNFWDLFSKIIY
jgi:hypothetical protein